MITIQRERTKTISLNTSGSATGVYIAIYHEWGDTVREPTLVSAGPGTTFTYTLTTEDTASAGVHRIVWTYTVATIEFSTTVHVKIYSPYTTSSVFFLEYPELESDCFDKFDGTESRVRKIIDTYCNQEFQYIKAKTLRLDGSGRDNLKLPLRGISFTEILRDAEDDVTELVEIDPMSEFWLRHTRTLPSNDPRDFIWDESPNFFSKRATYSITGDFGWEYIPDSIEEAAKLLIADDLNQDSLYRKHSVTFAGIGPVQTRYSPDVMASIGNVDADVLLMDFSRSLLEYI